MQPLRAPPLQPRSLQGFSSRHKVVATVSSCPLTQTHSPVLSILLSYSRELKSFSVWGQRNLIIDSLWDHPSPKWEMLNWFYCRVFHHVVTSLLTKSPQVRSCAWRCSAWRAHGPSPSHPSAFTSRYSIIIKLSSRTIRALPKRISQFSLR